MTALEEYEEYRRKCAKQVAIGVLTGVKADAAIAELQAKLAEADEKLSASEASEKVKLDLTTELLAKLAQAEAALRSANAESDLFQERFLQAEAEVERLKCCGNCDNYGDRGEDYNCAATPTGYHGYHPPLVVDPPDHCHFTPSRWDERGGEHCEKE